MSNVEKIDKALFQVMLNSGHRYTGLLDKIGYVYWTQETIFFVKIYPPLFGKDHSPRFELGITGKPFFEEISQLEIPYYRNRGYLVVDKQKYNHHRRVRL